MIYKDLEVTNFRGIKSLKVKDFQRINLFVGANNACKTSVLEAIYLLTGMSNATTVNRIDGMRSLLHNEGDDFRFIFNNLDYENTPSFRGVLHDNSERGLLIKPRLTSGLTSNIETKSSSLSGSSSAQSTLKADGLFYEFYTKSRHSERKNFKTSISMERERINVDPPKNYKESISGIFLSTRQDSHSLDHYKVVEELVINKKKSEILKVLNIIDPEIIDFELFSNNMIFFDKGLKQLEPSNLSGEGVKKLFGMIVNIFYYSNGIVIIDEIENGFYYKTLNRVWKAIIKACINYNVQIFITTHNYEILSELRNALHDDELSIYQNEVKTYSMVKESDKKLTAIGYTFEQFETALNNENEIR